MPTYDYRCEACKHAFEQNQSITAAPLRKCPACGKSALRRLMGTGGGIIFKGSGFYQTDYRSESYKKAAQAEKSGGSTTSDSKTASPKTGEKAAEPKKPAKAARK
jgi:putative FmdB family regulatory protein